MAKTLLDEALERPAGARFFRAALQVNPFSYAAAYRGVKTPADEPAYNTALLGACKRNGVEVVGIADHNSVEHLDRLRSVLLGGGIRVFPGFEIASAEKMHMVCLFPEDTGTTELNQHLGNLEAPSPGTEGRPSTLSALDIARRVADRGGVWFAAHVDSKSGLLRLTADGSGLPHIWKDEDRVLAVQLSRPLSELPAGIQEIFRNKDPQYKRMRMPAAIHAKDVAREQDLDDPKASTLIKMTAPSIEALRQAFLDPTSRVRFVEDDKTSQHERIEAIAWESGFLDGVKMRLSENLNAVVGGRGTGKSTVIETLRYALDLPAKGDKAKAGHTQIVKQNLGSGGRVHLRVRSAAQMGRVFTIVRQLGSPPEVRDDRGAKSNLRPIDLLPGIDILGQDEILELATNPGPRRHLLERFLPDTEKERTAAQVTRTELSSQRQRLLAAKNELDALEGDTGRLPQLQEQATRFRELGLDTALASMGKLSREKAIVKQIQELLASIAKQVANLDEETDLDLAFLDDEALSEVACPEPLKKMRGALDRLNLTFSDLRQAAHSALSDARTALAKDETEWKTRVQDVERELATVIGALPEMAGKTGKDVAKEFQRINDELARIQPKTKSVASRSALAKKLRSERDELLAQWRDAEHRRFTELRKAAEQLNRDELKGKLKIVVTHAGDRAPLRTFLQALDGVGTKKAEWVDHQDALTVAGLVDGLRAGKDKLLELFKGAGLQPGVAQVLVSLPEAKLLELEEIELEPTVSLELNVGDEERPTFRPLESLSTGQKCTAILHLLLVQSDAPLIVDQPEDHLDNAFIADRIVQELRAAKNRRQFLFATHNANIPVFGDAEWMGVLDASSDQATLGDESVGSVDKPSVQGRVAQVLEGGRDAFAMRRIKYGF